ncbi:divalent-cation tolerance protein CutA [Pseudomonadota bacterium]
MNLKQQVILSTCPDKETAKQISESLLTKDLAACINILPGVESIYKWKEQIECDQEFLLIIKTQTDAYPAVEKTILELHPYELPEIIAVPLANGLPAYLSWITDNSNASGIPA